jgi:ATP-dependent helicase/nuclease subunit A
MMTIHSAKGLQAPIVIIPYATKQHNFKHNKILWLDHQENKLSLPFVFTLQKYDDKIKSYMEQKVNQEIQENHRLFYVALTRAEEELYLTGLEKATKKDCNNWYQMSENAIKI